MQRQKDMAEMKEERAFTGKSYLSHLVFLRLKLIPAHNGHDRFRVFFLACGEFFATDRGETWGLGHYL